MASNFGYNISIFSPNLVLSDPPPTGDYNYGYQMAVGLATGGSLRLDPKGCIVNGRYDCITACYDPLVAPNMLWYDQNSMHTLANCLVTPVIVDLLQSGDLDSNALSIASQFGLVNDIQYGTSSTLAWEAINNCTVAYCNLQQFSTHSDSSCNLTESMYANASYLSDGSSKPSKQYTLRFNASLCDSNDASIDPEIGGIGMVASYMIQIFIALIFWVYIRTVFTWIEHSIIWWAMLRQALSLRSISRQSPPIREAISKAKRIGDRVEGWHLSKTVVTALVDFQKTQVLFILAVQISCLWAANNGSVTSSASYGQEQNNLALYQVIGLNGAIPVVLTLSTLHAAGQDSLYIDIASLVSLFIASATCLSMPPFSSLYSFDQPMVGGLAQCGGLESPMRYCTAKPDATLFFNRRAQLFIWLVPFLTGMGFMLKRVMNVFLDHHGDPIERKLRRDKDIHPLWNLLLTVVEIVLTVGCCYLLGAYFQILLPNKYPAIYNVASIFGQVQWTPGQVISVTIWAPIVIDFGYNLLLGFEKGFAYRLVAPYQVTNRDGQDGISIFSHDHNSHGGDDNENRHSLLHEHENDAGQFHSDNRFALLHRQENGHSHQNETSIPNDPRHFNAEEHSRRHGIVHDSGDHHDDPEPLRFHPLPSKNTFMDEYHPVSLTDTPNDET